jgi:hypothetical protein
MGSLSLEISSGVLRGYGNTGPFFSSIVTTSPIALGITKISENIMLASN